MSIYKVHFIRWCKEFHIVMMNVTSHTFLCHHGVVTIEHYGVLLDVTIYNMLCHILNFELPVVQQYKL